MNSAVIAHIIIIAAIVAIACGYVGAMSAAGYDLHWSWPNGRFVWVDATGRP